MSQANKIVNLWAGGGCRGRIGRLIELPKKFRDSTTPGTLGQQRGHFLRRGKASGSQSSIAQVHSLVAPNLPDLLVKPFGLERARPRHTFRSGIKVGESWIPWLAALLGGGMFEPEMEDPPFGELGTSCAGVQNNCSLSDGHQS